MAFTQPHTDEYGDEFPTSYWRPVQVNLCKADSTGMVQFYAYESAAKRGRRVVGQKAYAVTPELFAAFFGPDGLNPDGRNPWEAAYRLARAVKDKPAFVPVIDDNGVEVVVPASRVSFFEHAKDA